MCMAGAMLMVEKPCWLMEVNRRVGGGLSRKERKLGFRGIRGKTERGVFFSGGT